MQRGIGGGGDCLITVRGLKIDCLGAAGQLSLFARLSPLCSWMVLPVGLTAVGLVSAMPRVGSAVGLPGISGWFMRGSEVPELGFRS